MKKTILILIGLVFMTGAVYASQPDDKNKTVQSNNFSVNAKADASNDEQFYKDVTEFRKRLVYMKREMEKLIQDAGQSANTISSEVMGGFGDVKVDVVENEKDIVVRADIPGMDKDKIDISLEKNNILRISGMRDVEVKETSPGVVRQERMQGKFERVLTLPAECLNEGIKANYKNGVLEIIIPKAKKEESKPVKIKVQ